MANKIKKPIKPKKETKVTKVTRVTEVTKITRIKRPKPAAKPNPTKAGSPKPARPPAPPSLPVPPRPPRLPKPPKPAKKTAGQTKSSTPTQQRLWLMYPPKLIQEPLIWQLGHKFKVVTNLRQASVTDEIGIVCLEVDGKRDAVKAAIKWLEKAGINVEPVEINVIES